MNQILNLPKTNSKIFYLFYILLFALLSPIIILRNILIFHWQILLKLFLFISFLAIIGLWLLFIIQINIEISDQYTIGKYRNKLEKLLEEKGNLEMELAKINFSRSQAELMANLNFEKINQVQYIKVLSSQVVKK